MPMLSGLDVKRTLWIAMVCLIARAASISLRKARYLERLALDSREG
jgi:hypothetical protein